jgi:hypothetical protein
MAAFEKAAARLKELLGEGDADEKPPEPPPLPDSPTDPA